MAFAAFADAPVDVAIVEVGLGGTDDSTNVLHAGIVVITPIGLDHTEWLGDTLRDIALAKAGIVYPDATLILAVQPEEALEPIAERAVEVGATVATEGREFGVLRRELAVGGQVLTIQGLGGVYQDVHLPLHGAYQAQNAAVALAAVEAFLGAGAASRPGAGPGAGPRSGAASGAARGRPLDVETVRAGFAEATSPGRLERVRTAPTILLDAAHNPHGMAATVAALAEEFSFRRLVAVVAVLADKDATGMLELLEPVADAIVVSRNSSTRAMPVERLAATAVEVFGEDRVSVEPELPDAIAAAVALAEEDVELGLGGVGVLVTGSVMTVADARKLFRR
jgi:dihydrofolate synthase/folylpolyglutamate synthase